MSDIAYTPGPWAVCPRNKWRIHDHANNTVAATGGDSCLVGQHEANARLIAAAPEMLAEHKANARLLALVIHDLQGRVERGKLAALQQCLDRSNAAVAKAEG